MIRILLPLLLLLPAWVLAGSKLRLQQISVNEGLSQSSVNWILQDADGFIWLATGDGLNRFDGKGIVVYNGSTGQGASGQLADRNINSKMLEDRYGRLWFCADAGLYMMDKRKSQFTVVLGKYSMECAGIPLTIDSSCLWVAVPTKGIYEVNLKTLHSTLHRFTDTCQANQRVLNLVLSGDGNGRYLWIADRKGLIKFDKITKTDRRVAIGKGWNNVCRLHNGKIAATGYNGLYISDSAAGNWRFVPIADTGTEWGAIVEDSTSNTLYLAPRFGGSICRLNIKTWSYSFYKFQDANINCMYIDASRNLWVGTEGAGVYKLDVKPPLFSCYPAAMEPQQAASNTLMVKSIYRDTLNRIWMGVYNTGILIHDPVADTTHLLRLAPTCLGCQPNIIKKDSSGLVITTINNELVWLEEHTKKIVRRVWLKAEAARSSVPPTIYALTEWKKGHFLVGTNLGLYTVWLDGALVHAIQPKTLLNDTTISGWIYHLYNDGKGSVYIGQRRGYSHIVLVSDSQAIVKDYLLNGVPVRHFYKSQQPDVLWLASETGLMAYLPASRTYQSFNEHHGLRNSFIYGILPENDTTLWISTNRGLSKISVQYRGALQIHASNYTAADGLQSNEFNTGAHYQAADGTFFFGGITGINWFRPGVKATNPFAARPCIAAIYINDSLYAGDTANYVQHITLPYPANTVSMQLRALEYTETARNQFSYMLEGVDNDWVTTYNDWVRYPSLPPGQYTFVLKTSNNAGVWSPASRRLIITILPPWWQLWWFRTLLVVVAASVTLLAIRYYVRHKVQVHIRELEQQQALNNERIRISKDVHDDLGAGLSKISLMAAIAMQRQGQQGSELKHISTITKNLLDNMHDLIWVLNPEHTTLDNLAARIREYCTDYLDSTDIDCLIEIPEQLPIIQLTREAQRNVFAVVKEAMSNIVKHARATEVKVQLSLQGTQLRITIADNGRGIGPLVRPGGNGLGNMAQRMDAIGGSLTIANAVPNGTLLTLQLQITQ